MKTLLISAAFAILGNCNLAACDASETPVVRKGDRVAVITMDGRVQSGVIVTIDKKSIVLQLDKGGISKIERANIEEMRKLPKEAGTLPHRTSLGNSIPPG